MPGDPHARLQEVVGAGQLWYKRAPYDRDPIPAWTKGRVTILGDACAPDAALGAGQAIEDGCVLAAALHKLGDDPVGAPQLYERSRRPRVSRIVLTSRARGDEIRIAAREGFRGDVIRRGEA